MENMSERLREMRKLKIYLIRIPRDKLENDTEVITKTQWLRNYENR